MHPNIEAFCRSSFRDRDAGDFAAKWLGCFYGNDNITQTLQAQTMIFSGFGGNPFYAKNSGYLYAICANAIMAYADGAQLLAKKDQTNSGVMAIMQGVEPAISAARLCGMDAGQFRVDLLAVVNSLASDK